LMCADHEGRISVVGFVGGIPSGSLWLVVVRFWSLMTADGEHWGLVSSGARFLMHDLW
jgi:hypothetical protein